jgi:hypothetical protein
MKNIKKKKAVYRKGGHSDILLSFLENTISYTKKSSLFAIFKHNFSKFLELSLEYDDYINIGNDYLDILNENKQAALEYKDYNNLYDEEFNPEFNTFFNDFKNTTKYNGVYSWRFQIKIPDHHDENNSAKKCFELSSMQLNSQFRKLIKKLNGKMVFKSIIQSTVNESTYDQHELNDEEYIAFEKNYMIYIIFSRNVFRYPGQPDQYFLHVGAHYITFDEIAPDFDFDTARSQIFDKYIVTNPVQKWQVIYDKDRRKVELDAMRTTRNPNDSNKFSKLDMHLTRHIFSLANKLTEYKNDQMNKIIKKAISTYKKAKS